MYVKGIGAANGDRPGVKNDADKRRLDLIPAEALLAIGDVLTYGAKKYEPDNWKKIPNARDRIYGAALRHILAWRSGEIADNDSGLSHIAHAITNLMFLIWFDNNDKS
jgi:hypothetical protein